MEGVYYKEGSVLYIYFRTAWRLSRTWNFVSTPVTTRARCATYLQLNLSLGDLLLAAVAICNLLCLCDLSPDVVGAEVLKRETLDGVDAQLRVGLDNGKSSGYC